MCADGELFQLTVLVPVVSYEMKKQNKIAQICGAHG